MDAVITYVNGLDPLWQKEYADTVGGDILQKRFRDWGTLPYLYRGIRRHMPYINNVYLVVSGQSQVPDWVKDSITWLNDMIGGIDSTGLTPPVFGSKVNGNREAALNLDCTIAYLAAHPEGKKILEEVTGGQQSFPAAAAGVITLRDSLGYLGFDPEKTKAVEAKLLAIKNK